AIRFGYAEVLLRQVAEDSDDLRVSGAPVRPQIREFFLRALANEHVDRFSALQQIGDEKAADESGGTGDEIGHEVLLELAKFGLFLSRVSGVVVRTPRAAIVTRRCTINDTPARGQCHSISVHALGGAPKIQAFDSPFCRSTRK